MAHVITYDIDTTKFTDTSDGRSQRTQLYQAIKAALEGVGFVWMERSVYKCDDAGPGPVLNATAALKAVPKFMECVDHLHHFEVTNTTDLKGYL